MKHDRRAPIRHYSLLRSVLLITVLCGTFLPAEAGAQTQKPTVRDALLHCSDLFQEVEVTLPAHDLQAAYDHGYADGMCTGILMGIGSHMIVNCGLRDLGYDAAFAAAEHTPEDGWNAFLTWARGNQEHQEWSLDDGLITAIGEAYPCE